jgi:hypothetical protein
MHRVEQLDSVDTAEDAIADALPLPSRQVNRILLGWHDLETSREPVPRREQQTLERVERRLAQPSLDEADGVLARARAQGELSLADALSATCFAHERRGVDHLQDDTASGIVCAERSEL